MAISAFDNGDYFPIWGGCMGMQQMMMISEGTDNQNLLQRFDSFNNLMLPLIMDKKGIQSRMMKYVIKNSPKTMNEFLYKESTLNNHMMGLSPEKFKSSGLLNSAYKIVSWNYDGADNNGMPVESVNQEMIRLEDAIGDKVEVAAICRHIYSRTGNNLKEFVYHIKNDDQFIDAFNSALNGHPRYPVEISFYEDKEWEDFQRLLNDFNKDG